MSSASLRALAAVGGALGVLPLIPIARTLAIRASGPPRLIGRELADLDFKSATYAEAAVLLLVMPLAALLFGHVLPRMGAGILPGLVFASGWIGWRLGMRPIMALAMGAGLALIALLLALGLARGKRNGGRDPAAPAAPAVPAPDAPADRKGRAAPAVVLLLLALCGWRLFWQRRAHLEYYENGHLLGNAQTYLLGGRPYLDTYPVHGWGSDGGVDALAFRIAAPTLEVAKFHRAAMASLSLAGMALMGWALFRRWRWTAVAFLLGLGICTFLSERQLPAFLAVAALVGAARARSRRLWFLAGALGALTLFFTLDFGVFFLTGALAAAAALGLAERSAREALASAGLLALGALAGALPFLAVLARAGAVGAFLRVSFVQLPGSISDIWGLPAGTTIGLFRDGSPSDWFAALCSPGAGAPLRWLTPVLLLALAAAILLFRAAAGRPDAVDRGALAATAVAMVAVRGLLGRMDAGHLALYGVLVGLPAAWLLYRAAHARRFRALLVLALAVPLWLRFEPLWAVRSWWMGIQPWRPAVQGNDCWRSPLRGGRTTVPCAEADALEELHRYVDAHLGPGETFFDFSNQAALYFYLDRRNPVRFVAAPFYEPAAFQREVIDALERVRPPLVILPHGEWTDEFDGIANALRTPLVADYVYANYRVVEVVAGRFVGWRPPQPVSP